MIGAVPISLYGALTFNNLRILALLSTGEFHLITRKVSDAIGSEPRVKINMLIGDILKERIKDYNTNHRDWADFRSKEYIKKWNRGVDFFLKEINKDQTRQKLKPFSFIAIRQQLIALREIDDLRWFYYHCIKYSKTKDKNGVPNTFSKCFWGSLKIR